MIDFGYGVQLDTIEKAAKARLWRNDPEQWQYFRQFDLITEAEQEAWVKKVSLSQTERMYTIMCGIKPIGVCGLTSINYVHAHAEISIYTIGGKLRESLKTLVDHAFKNLHLHRLWADCFYENAEMQKTLLEIGFIHEGTMIESYFKNGKYIDSYIFGLIRK